MVLLSLSDYVDGSVDSEVETCANRRRLVAIVPMPRTVIRIPTKSCCE